MTRDNELRLLPWSGTDGKPCFLSTDDANGHLSRLADNTEAIQLGLASELLDHASEVLGDTKAAPGELRALAQDLAESLRDTLRVAESRGYRVPLPSSDTHGNDAAGPTLPAAAFG
ncbi:hypothetical protein ACFY8F_10925 [Streptomyces tanashiensis]|uniref:hypothetical protein n=1 Tax=Streptomyces tanashiensis TaxID=67367 RepID=UPI0036D0D965